MNPQTPTMNRPVSTEDLSRQTHADDGTRTPHPESTGHSSNAPLLPPEMTQRLRDTWTDVQAGFVDEPRQAVHRADELVATAIKELADTFARERATLEH